MSLFNCKDLIHPFHFDPGVSQKGRITEHLLADAIKIDGRTLADLLDYFLQLSQHINYYDTHLKINDWQLFFKRSLPFTISNIIKYDGSVVKDKLDFYNTLFNQSPSPSGLQLNMYYIFYSTIYRINEWHIKLAHSELPLKDHLETFIKDSLSRPAKEFISHVNFAAKWFHVKRLNFVPLFDNQVWGIEKSDLSNIADITESRLVSRCESISALFSEINKLGPLFIEAANSLSLEAESNLEPSMFPWLHQILSEQDDLRDNQDNQVYQHAPHLGLMFAFLNMFRQLQGDLNSYSKKHLDFFYTNVLQIKPAEAKPDHAHILFEIQKNLKSYLLKKGIEVKDGKDENKADVLFALNDEIVVNKTKVEEKRTLFLNNQTINEKTYVEGVYMAPKAEMADGVDKEFKDENKNWSTIGAKNSKYINPETKTPKIYPSARLGFVLASPVLLLNEGKRKIEITINYKLEEQCPNPIYFSSPNFIKYINEVIEGIYIIYEDIFENLKEKGNCDDIINRLIKIVGHTEFPESYCQNGQDPQTLIFYKHKIDDEFDVPERKQLLEFINIEKPFKILFSGNEGWIEPSLIEKFEFTEKTDDASGAKYPVINISCTLEADKPPVTFYDNNIHKEDINIQFPAVKIEINDNVKLKLNHLLVKESESGSATACCLLKKDTLDDKLVSIYHFLRNLVVLDKTIIDVEVCGVKNLIVQNDENLQDVNSPILPFGTRPKVGEKWVVDEGANFYIGSEEIFQKNWQQLWLNTTWKDKPQDLESHYKFYKDPDYEDGSSIISNASFRFSTHILEDYEWKKAKNFSADKLHLDLLYLFENYNNNTNPCNNQISESNASTIKNSNSDTSTTENNTNDKSTFCHEIDKILIQDSKYYPKSMSNKELLPLGIHSQNGFLRLTLSGVSFQHDRFTYVLARQMMALADLIDPKTAELALYKIRHAKRLCEIINPRVSRIIERLNSLLDYIGKLRINMDLDCNPLAFTIDCDGIKQLVVELKRILDSVSTSLSSSNLTEAKNIINKINEKVGYLGQSLTVLGQIEGLSIEVIEVQKQFIATPDDYGDSIPDNLIETSIADNETEEDLTNDWEDLPEYGLEALVKGLCTRIVDIHEAFKEKGDITAGIPNEPYTPTIKELSIDYKAIAEIEDINLIHLYPYKNTHKAVDIQNEPSLFPVFCDEGTLFLGLKELVPGTIVNILFQLAEATADTESEKAELHWHYLDNNEWKALRNGFEILDDATNGLTTSGVVKFALPEKINSSNTIMPKDLFWIKASVPSNSKAISETIGIYAQAIRATFTNKDNNDKLRLSKPLEQESIAKLNIADASVTKVIQPYESFGGQVPESEGYYYVRVSELLRHKGRSIQKWDYERLCLEAFPQIFKAKCINHSFALDAYNYDNDFPYAPGYVMLAVIPDLKKLKAGISPNPKVPASLVKEIQDYLKKRTSSFVRLRVMNPRYEKVHICLKAKLLLGKDENYYREKMKADLKEFLAPWIVGKYDKLRFGQSIYRSDIIKFLENRNYLDYILELKMNHENNQVSLTEKSTISPLTPRSVLIAGEIDICILQQDCEEWLEPVQIG